MIFAIKLGEKKARSLRRILKTRRNLLAACPRRKNEQDSETQARSGMPAELDALVESDAKGLQRQILQHISITLTS